jgi:uncharacterized protein (TIGR03067 family)
MTTALREEEIVREEEAQRDRQRLQGGWKRVAGNREANLAVTGSRFVMAFRTGEVYEGTFTLDPACRPREIDLRIESAPDAYLGKDALAIYQLDGDHLIFASGLPGSGQRPSVFPHESEPGQLYLIFRRAE